MRTNGKLLPREMRMGRMTTARRAAERIVLRIRSDSFICIKKLLFKIKNIYIYVDTLPSKSMSLLKNDSTTPDTNNRPKNSANKIAKAVKYLFPQITCTKSMK